MSKFAKSHKEQMEDTKTGKTYRSCAAIKTAKKNTKEICADMTQRNSNGMHIIPAIAVL